MPQRISISAANAINRRLENKRGEALLQLHHLHEGLYARVATVVGVDPSYVSRVARGERRSEKIQHALVAQFVSIQKKSQKIGR